MHDSIRSLELLKQGSPDFRSNFMQGVANSVLISIPVWALIVAAFVFAFRECG